MEEEGSRQKRKMHWRIKTNRAEVSDKDAQKRSKKCRAEQNVVQQLEKPTVRRRDLASETEKKTN